MHLCGRATFEGIALLHALGSGRKELDSSGRFFKGGPMKCGRISQGDTMPKPVAKPTIEEEKPCHTPNEEEVLDWDDVLEEKPAPRRKGTIEVILTRVERPTLVLEED